MAHNRYDDVTERRDRTRTAEARYRSQERRQTRRDKYAATPVLTKGVAL